MPASHLIHQLVTHLSSCLIQLTPPDWHKTRRLALFCIRPIFQLTPTQVRRSREPAMR